MKVQRGFTLIELVVVIVILGIMAAIAVPKFVDITADAHTAAARGTAGALSSGSAINFATRTANSTKGTAVYSTNVCNSTTANLLLTTATGATGPMVATTPTTDDTFQISGTGDCTAANVAAVNCTVTPKGGSQAIAVLMCVQ